jgi:signal transduction histidine kinase
VTALAIAGWVVAVALIGWVLRLRRRLELAARAEHELRGPLAALALGVESLRRDPLASGHAEGLDAELERARAGLRDLDAARRGRRAASRPERVALDCLARSTARAWDPVARRYGRRVRVDWAAGPVAVHADRGRLSQALGNVVANAVEHGEGTVEVKGARVRGAVRVEVHDAGGGPRPGALSGVAGGRGLRIAADAVSEAGGTLAPVHGERGGGVAIELPER